MSSTIFILGAGASRAAGAPLMGDFLDVAHERWKLGLPKPDDLAYATVFKAISKLQQVHSKAHLQITNVESVFAAFEMAKTLQSFAGYSPNDIDALIAAMRRVIVSTIESTVSMIARNNHIPDAPEPYPQFVDLIRRMREESKPRQTVSVLTFNYDMALDFALFRAGIPIDYGLGDHRDERAINLLKLHGSLNWATCDKCNSVIPWHLTEYFRKFNWQIVRPGDRPRMTIGSQLAHFSHCDAPVRPEPVIVPPTWNKTEYHREISKVWATAAAELATAENIYIIGYSMPDSDSFFRYLFALATVSDTLLKRFWVVDPDSSGTVEKRFRALLGPGATERFHFSQTTFQDCLTTIEKHHLK